MTPQQKAKELILKYGYVIRNAEDQDGFLTNANHAKECALIAVDEIEKAIDFDWMEVQNLESEHRFWNQVKQEIEKL